VKFRFERRESDGGLGRFERDLPDDTAALEWMGRESLAPDDVLFGFRDGDEQPFARRTFQSLPEVLR
jgi:hypothetical protein